jgi:transcriptional regulator with XRE-family HTH domain
MTGPALYTIRKRLGFTQKQFAEQIGVAPNSVARWERGELKMKKSTELLVKLLALHADLTTGEVKDTMEITTPNPINTPEEITTNPINTPEEITTTEIAPDTTTTQETTE